ncbi:MAG: universal stress protein [Thermodesulfobacteriota bacterium]|nr:universal stress protein [Thermodesulfobacteriota bacterium]
MIMDIRIIRDMCAEPCLCIRCKKRLCGLVHHGNDCECIIDRHYATAEGLYCETCYVAEKKRRTSEPYQEKILLAVDGSDWSMEAVRHVAKVVARQRAFVVLFHVKKHAELSYKDMGTHPLFRVQSVDLAALEGTQKRAMEQFMKRGRQIFLDAGFPEEAVRVQIRKKRASVVRDIVEESKEGYTTIVVGRKGLSRLRDAVLGNVTARLLQKRAHVPIWII